MTHINHNISLKGLTGAVAMIAAVLTGLLVSCVQIEQNGQETGYINFAPLSVDVTVEGLEPTKVSVPAENVPESGDFTYTIVGKADGRTYYSEKGLPTGTISLPVGAYKVDAVYGANQFNQAYYSASVDDVLIEAGQVKNIDFGAIPLTNAMVAVTLPDMTGHMEINSISLSDGVNTIPVESGKYYFAPAGQGAPSVTASFSGVNSLGEEKTVSQNLGVLESQHAYNVVCNLELPTFTFANQASGAIAGRLYLTSLAELGGGLDASKVMYQISSDGGSSWKHTVPVAKDGYWVISQTKDGSALASNGTSYQIRAVYGGLVAGPWSFTPSMPVNTLTGVSITHDYVSSVPDGFTSAVNVLTGSTAEVSGTGISYPDIVATLISSKGSRGVKLLKGSTEVRILTGKETGNMSVADGWTYLPQGTYMAVPYFTIGDENIELSSLSAASPAPAFTAQSAAFTSHSKFEAAGASEANKYDGSTIYGLQNVATSIAPSILADGRYSKSLTVKLDGAAITSENAAGQNWDTHRVDFTYVFDDVTVSGTRNLSVSGLPHSASFYGVTSAPSGWTVGGKVEWSGYGWNDGDSAKYLRLRGESSYSNRGYALSPQFNIGEVNVKTTLDCFYYHSTNNKTSTIYVNANSASRPEVTTNGTVLKTAAKFNDFDSIADVVNSMTLTSSKPRVSITHAINSVDKGPLFNSTYFFGIKSILIQYAP